MPPEAQTFAASLQEAEALCSTTLRALVGDARLQWSGGRLYQDQIPRALHAPHQVLDDLPQSALRALTDGLALRLIHSDSALFETTAPDNAVAHLVFELLEQLRVESLAPEACAGLVRNVQDHFRLWGRRFVDSGLTETAVGILIFTIAHTAWSRLNSLALAEGLDDLMEGTRASIMPRLGGAFAALRRSRHDQGAYSAAALDISHWVAQAIEDQQERSGGGAAARRRSGFALPLLWGEQALDPFALATTGRSASWEATQQAYRVFSRRYDREIEAATLVREAQLAGFRGEMDEEVAQSSLNVPRLARTLRLALSQPVQDSWDSEQTEGVLDGRRLAQLVSSPADHRIFRTRATQPLADCAVALLLDCSGSMKNHIQPVSLLADVLARALDMAGVACEVLGFTTGGWNGGRVRRDWLRAGSPGHPGRLNEQVHLVFKAAQTPWKRARRSIAALRKPDLYKEGVDGEALEWASQRLRAVAARRRIVLVLSDGCPMDTATHAANDPQYLDQHLQSVLRRLQVQGDVEVCALGVGLDLGVFYRHRLAVNLADGLTDAILQALAALLCAPRVRGRH